MGPVPVQPVWQRDSIILPWRRQTASLPRGCVFPRTCRYFLHFLFRAAGRFPLRCSCAKERHHERSATPRATRGRRCAPPRGPVVRSDETTSFSGEQGRNIHVSSIKYRGPSRRQVMKTSGQIAVASALAGVTIPHVHAAETNTIQLSLAGSGSRATPAAVNVLPTNS